MQCYSKARQNNRDPTFIYSFVSNHFLLDLEYIQRLIGNSCGISLFSPASIQTKSRHSGGANTTAIN